MEPFDISNEIGNTTWIDSFGFECGITKQVFQENLKRFSDNAGILKKRQGSIRQLRNTIIERNKHDPKGLMEVDDLFRELKALETQLEEFESAPKE